MRDRPQALLLDFGGVLTQPMLLDLDVVDRRNDFPDGTTARLLAEAYGDGGADTTIARLERGALSIPEFEALLADELGIERPTGGMVQAIFGELRLAGRLWSAAQLLRDAGVRTALLSNSWGTSGYPMELLRASFDELVISGEVGLRKPDPAIYHLTAERLGVPLAASVFVDDHPRNLKVARALDITTVLHRGDEDEVLHRLQSLFDVDLSGAVDVEQLAAR